MAVSAEHRAYKNKLYHNFYYIQTRWWKNKNRAERQFTQYCQNRGQKKPAGKKPQ